MTATINFDLLKSSDPKVKYGFTKGLLKIGADKPGQLYSYLDDIVVLLNNKNNILKWTGIDLVGYLSIVDKDNKIDRQITQLVRLLHGGHLITCNHAIFALGLIAQNKPKHKRKIIKEFLLVDKNNFETNECKNIATGKVLEAFKLLIPDIMHDKKAIDFIYRATENNRNATKNKVIQLTNKIQKSLQETKGSR